ncbi:hypothetical protein [Streptomyces sp. NPDC086989]|uniref:hypothetical protein n=1 Tax=Streptomyces sp. NPDC086989 TaxID=3365764 RepID=UPI0037FB2B6E
MGYLVVVAVALIVILIAALRDRGKPPRKRRGSSWGDGGGFGCGGDSSCGSGSSCGGGGGD